MKAASLVLRFLLELAAFAALGYWGFHEHGGFAAALLGLGAPMLAIVLWGLFVAPRRPIRRGEALRWAVELLVFGAAAIALIDAGAVALGVAFGVLALANGALVRFVGDVSLDSRA
jgi:hypothetical protein